MRGPLLSGPLGSAVTLARVCQIARERPPVIVLSALWLAQALAAEVPVTVLIEPDKRKAAARALKRSQRKGARLTVLAAGERIPLGAGAAGCILLDRLSEIAEGPATTDFLGRLGGALRSEGVIVALDATRSRPAEARLAELFLAAALTGITQERPRDGALLTIGRRPPAEVLAAPGGS
jgi:hypothetical protein